MTSAASKNKMTSFENASILRKFTIFFSLMSLIPLGVLYYFYLQVKDSGHIEISADSFSLMLGIVVIGAAVGYWAMRSIFKKLVTIARSNQQTLSLILGPQKIRDLSKEENEIALLAQSFTEMTNQLEENVKHLESTKQKLHTVLSKVGQGITKMESIDSFLDLIVETVVDAFSGKVGFLLLDNGRKNEMFVKAVHGARLKPLASLNITTNKDDEPLASILDAKKPIIIKSIDDLKYKSHRFDPIFELPMISAPLILRDEVIGAITVCGKEVIDDLFQKDEINLIANLALQTSVAIDNSRLNQDVEKTYFETISALALAVDAKDKYSRGHLDRVASYAIEVGKKMNLDDNELSTLHDGAKLHDIGKIGVPDEILLKPTKLTKKEMEVMKQHTVIGESIIKPISSLGNLCDIVRHHHEKLDGSGYPDGLKKDQIPLLVRILTVVDIYDALTTNRPYRKKFSEKAAIKELRNMEGQIDQEIVDILFETVNR